jgi:PKD repeat protein
VSITSDSYASTTGAAVMSGTSMAAPHVAGAAALYLAANPTATPTQVVTALTANATSGSISAIPANTVNRLLNVQFIAAPAPVNAAPTATITAPSAGASFVQGTSIAFAGTGNDPESGALSGAALVWKSNVNGQIGTGSTLSTSALSVGTHVITLTAKDPQGATGVATRTITVTAPTTGNLAPTASFTWTCTGFNLHQCQFDGSGSTDDRGVVSYAWTWGNGSGETKTWPITKKTYATAGSYTVTLRVTDAAGLTASVSKVVTVP